MNGNAIRSIKYFLMPLGIAFLVINAAYGSSQNNGKHQPRKKYGYQLPARVDDGWQISSLTKEDIDPEGINDLMEAILNGSYMNIHSILLVRNGKLVLEEYFHGYHREKLHQIRSATKSIGSVLIGIAIDKEFISNASQKVYPYFRSYDPKQEWDERTKDVKLRHLLTMTSGYDCDDHNSNFGCEKKMYESSDWVEYALNLPFADQPGKHWAYNSASLSLVGEMISKTSNMNIPDFAEKYLFDPLGIADFQWGFSPKGRAWLAGNAKMRPRDMAKFGYMVLNEGRWQNKQIVSKKWLKESTAEHVPLPHMRLHGGNYGYGYLWWSVRLTVKNHILDAIAASGNGGQIITVFPTLDLVAVFTGGNYNNSLSAQPVAMLIRYILPAMM
jgi:CubicO group peptidase (beta-lactamase class C family)